MMGGTFNQSSTTGATPSHNSHAQGYGASLPQYHQHSASPAPIQHPHQYAQQSSSTYTQPQHVATPSHPNHYSAPASRYVPPVNQRLPGASINALRPQEIYHLPENANLAIPEETRNQFQQDAHGHVLFWTAPPVETLAPVKPGSAIGHTARYLADKLRSKTAARGKRKADGLPAEEEDQPDREAKTANHGVDDVTQQQIEELKVKALWKWNEQLQASTDNIYKKLYGQHWEEGKKYELEKLARKQADHRKHEDELEKAHGQRISSWEKARAAVTDSGVYRDDFDPRY